MIGTVCFIADLDTENFLNEFKVEASEQYHVGVTGGNVPRHISLGMPYTVKDWNAYISFVEDFVKDFHPIEVTIDTMGTTTFPTPDKGAFFLKFQEAFGLDSIRENLRDKIKKDLDVEITDSLLGKRLIMLGCGTAGKENYDQYVAQLDKSRYVGKKLRFDKIGIFYYPSANWDPSTYICYKRIQLH